MGEAFDEPVLVPGESASPSYEPFDRVFVDDDSGTLVVLASTGVRSAAFDMGGVTMADVYPECPLTDDVVIVAYERALDRDVRGWREMDPAQLSDCIGLLGDVHYYPASKLSRYEAGNFTEVGGVVRCEHCKSMHETTAAWVRHVAVECREVDHGE